MVTVRIETRTDCTDLQVTRAELADLRKARFYFEEWCRLENNIIHAVNKRGTKFSDSLEAVHDFTTCTTLKSKKGINVTIIEEDE